MTERKPPGVDVESWVDKQITDAMGRGDFDNLPLAGKPLPGAGREDDENWWLTSYLRREAPDVDAMLPPEMLLRKEIERLPETVRGLGSEDEVRAAVARINDRVRQSWRTTKGPQLPVRLVNADNVVARWHTDREAAAVGAEPAPAPAPEPVGPWWRRFTRQSDAGWRRLRERRRRGR
jgi:hypothetical protein